jgi:hypothetical protein
MTKTIVFIPLTTLKEYDRLRLSTVAIQVWDSTSRMDSSVAKIPLQDCKMANSDLQDQILHQNFEILDLTEKLCLTNAHLISKQKQLISKLEDDVLYWKRQAEEATARCKKQQEDFNRIREGIEDAKKQGPREEVEQIQAKVGPLVCQAHTQSRLMALSAVLRMT